MPHSEPQSHNSPSCTIQTDSCKCILYNAYQLKNYKKTSIMKINYLAKGKTSKLNLKFR